MSTFILIVLGAAVFTVLGWVAAALLWLKNADLEDEKWNLRDRLKDAYQDNARLKHVLASERMSTFSAPAANVVPIRPHKGRVP